jgi:hypothetical protein
MRQQLVCFPERLSIHDDFLDEEEIAEKNETELQYELINNFFKVIIPNYGKSVTVGNISKREFDLFHRHNMISAVDLCYKMLASVGIADDDSHNDTLSQDIIIVRHAMQHIHDARVPPELVPGFLILIIKYHFYV